MVTDIYFLYLKSLCNQTKCVDVLLLITRSGADEVSIYTYTDSNTAT